MVQTETIIISDTINIGLEKFVSNKHYIHLDTKHAETSLITRITMYENK